LLVAHRDSPRWKRKKEERRKDLAARAARVPHGLRDPSGYGGGRAREEVSSRGAIYDSFLLEFHFTWNPCSIYATTFRSTARIKFTLTRGETYRRLRDFFTRLSHRLEPRQWPALNRSRDRHARDARVKVDARDSWRSNGRPGFRAIGSPDAIARDKERTSAHVSANANRGGDASRSRERDAIIHSARREPQPESVLMHINVDS